MKKNSPTEVLHVAIQLLQQRQRTQLAELQEEAHLAYLSLQPVHIIKSTLQQAANFVINNINLPTNAAQLITGFITGKVFPFPLKAILFPILQSGISKLFNPLISIKRISKKISI